MRAKTAAEVLEKYKKAEKISTGWERVTIFSWNDMLLLKDEIAKLKELNGRAARAIEYIEKIVQLGNKNFELTRMERELITELREAAK